MKSKLFLALIVGGFFGFFGGTVVQLNQDSKTLEERVFTMFGEDDYGLQVNEYLQTGIEQPEFMPLNTTGDEKDI